MLVKEDPESLTQFVHGCKGRGVTPAQLLKALDLVVTRREAAEGAERKTYDGVIYGILLALGEYQLADVPENRQETLPNQLVEWYALHPSSAVHGATGWLLRQWGFDREVRSADETPTPGTDEELFRRQWFVKAVDVKQPDGQSAGKAESQHIYFTFVVLPPGGYRIGSPDDERDRQIDEQRQRIPLTRPVAVTDCEVTWAQWNPMDGATHHDRWQQQFSRSLSPQDPAFGINWFEAVNYCRWLNRQIRISEAEQWYADRPLPSHAQPGWVDLPDTESWPVNQEGSGFRLLTEAEWETVCRGGAATSYSFGSDRSLLGRYGWYIENSDSWSHRAAGLRPNPYGLFDVHGNLLEWCHNWYSVEAGTDPLGPERGSDRVNRGGGWDLVAAYCRTALRFRSRPSDRSYDLGFRLALVPPSSGQAGGSGAASGSRAADRAEAEP
jgi:formylglycine-generating enzyme required for sulfatase activity